ncbi:MAG: LysM peptidoglycan-binding domain-containing protein [Kiritimatiellae bacterium]|nr:LysM peptidoglycan-binding domain-containing protein [Kiritimatiellia bacterium]
MAALQREEAQDEVFARAREAQLAGRIEEARDLYADLVLAQPFNAMARFQLAVVLQDSVGDPAAAIGQYEAYLRLAPGSDKEEIARERLRSARDQVARRFGAIEHRNASDADVEKLSRELADAREALAAAEAARADAEAMRDKAFDDVAKLRRTVSGLQRQIDILQGGGAAVAVPSGSAGGSGPRTYKVKRGDTLTSIAQRVYGDATRNRDIRAANPGKIGEGDSIQAGDILVLPE